MSNATELRHYTHYPMCGYCYNAWNIVYCRTRSLTSPGKWVEWCPSGGCDPDIWDHIDENTGWPEDWKLDSMGHPKGYRNPKKYPLFIPKTDNRVYHLRADDDSNAPWRKTSSRLRNEQIARTAKKKGLTIDDIEWDEDPEPSAVPPEFTPTSVDDIEWDDDDDEDLFGPHGDDVVQHAEVAAESAAADWADDPDLW